MSPEPLSILRISAHLTDIRERRRRPSFAPRGRTEPTAGALQQDLADTRPTTVTEAFLMAAELYYMLEEGACRQRSVRVADALAAGLMQMSREGHYCESVVPERLSPTERQG